MLSNKVIVITGGAGLIGQEFVKAVVKSKGVAIIADIDSKLGADVTEQLKKELDSESIEFVELDITSKESLQLAIKNITKKHQNIDALVNNAYPRNKKYGRKFFEVQYGDFVANTSMNLGGYFLASQQFSILFKEQGYGNIINISSVYGVIAPKFEIYEGTPMTMPVEYAAIKAGLIHITKYMAKYFKGLNIRVNAISPGGVLDGQPKQFLDSYNQTCANKGMLEKSDLNGTLIYLLSDLSESVNGQNIIVDNGFSL